MAITINVNNLTLCHKGSGGISMATIPDVCKTPPLPIPIPYPNISFSSDLAKGTKTVKADGGNMIAVQGSEFSKSTGDEPGVAGGVVSGVNMKESTWITFSFDVKMEGKAACRLTDKKFQNHMNTVDMAGLLQQILNPRPLNWPWDYGYWCGLGRAPAAKIENEIPDDESRWDDWVKEKHLPQPYDAMDYACMLHDLRLGKLRKTDATLAFYSLDLRVTSIHLKLLGEFAFQAANPLNAFDPGLWIYSVGGTTLFAAMSVITASRDIAIGAVAVMAAVGSVAASATSDVIIAADAATVAVASAAVSAAGAGVSLAGKAAGAVSSAVTAAGDAVSSAGAAVGGVGTAVHSAGDVLSWAGATKTGTVVKWAGQAVSAAGTAVSAAGDALSSVGAAASVASAAVSAAGDAVSSAAASAASTAVNVAGDALHSAGDAIASLFR